MQRFILVLRKLGILRYGTKSYRYTSGKDMPAQAILDDVYDEEKDLVTRSDFIKKNDLKKTGSQEEHSNYCTRCGEKLTDKACRCTCNNTPPKQ